MPVKLGFIVLSIIGVLRIPEEFYLYKDKDKDTKRVIRRRTDNTMAKRKKNKRTNNDI